MTGGKMPLGQMVQNFVFGVFSMNNLSLTGSFAVLACASFWFQPLITLAQTLPPPPPIANPSQSPLKTSVPQLTTPPPLEVPTSSPLPLEVPVASPQTEPSQPIREFTFQAPSDNTPEPAETSIKLPVASPTTTIPVKANFYRVEVAATDESILEQVRDIEPFAFFEREHQVVYAGRFHQQDQAQQRVQELTQKGLSAQVVPVSQESGQNRISPR